ncbi:MAG: alpha/beta hydrolase, partial [Chloroflexota bacterium]
RLAPLDAGKTMRALAPSIVQQIVGPKAQPEGVALAVQRMEAIPDETFRAAILSLADFDQRANLGSIDIPCLLIVGSEDTNAPPPMMEKMASKISGAHYHCLPDLGHLAHLENAIMFNQALATFLEGLK